MHFNDDKEFGQFLKALAEQSVKKTYSSLLTEAPEDEEEAEDEGGEEDPLFGGGDEGDEEEGEEDADLADLGDELGDAGGEEEPQEQPEEPREDKVSFRPTPLTLELGEVSTDGLIATLNMIRAGRSFKEPDIASELRNYFEDNLNDSERLALATFLSGIRDVVSGMAASEAPDPGDENVKIDTTDVEKKDAQQQTDDSVELKAARVPSAGTRKRSGGLEDTSAPISVGPRNEARQLEIANYVKSLLKEIND